MSFHLPYPPREAVPTRAGVVLTADSVTCPPKPARWSQARYRAAYDADPIIVWERIPNGALSRFRLAGPVSAAAWLAGHTGVVVVAWEADAAPITSPPTALLGTSS